MNPTVPAQKIPTPLIQVAVAAVAWVALYRTILPFWNWVVYGLGGLDPATRLGSGVQFFFYDTTKILLLLAGIIFIVAVIRSFFTVEGTRRLLGGRAEGWGNALAASLGVVTPFCSCSAVPAFIGFVSAGVPLGVTFSFLIASPMVNEVAIVMLLGLFGWPVTLLYIASGLVLALVAGLIIGRLNLERFVEPSVYTMPVGQGLNGAAPTWAERLQGAVGEVRDIIGRIWPYLLVGIGVGALIHGWAPADFFARYAGRGNPLAVPIAVLAGVPLYSNAAGVLPIVTALHEKGLPMGTLLAFMQAVVGLSLPEAIILRRVLKPQLIAAFIGITSVGIVLIGYLFNAVLG
ncbi:MAG TPA: permease [Deinococcales bacterium]|nr:permease [Deinococcales bacterium]